MKLTWTNSVHTQVRVEDERQITSMPADPANPAWAAIAARVAAGELTIADYAAPAAPTTQEQP